MSSYLSVRAATLPDSSLRQIPQAWLCADYIKGFCRRGDQCLKNHEICDVSMDTQLTRSLHSFPNYLSLEPRGSLHDRERFDEDGPGELSVHGPRHDNDYIDITDIRILPTTDEILCRRAPYMPKKGDFTPHHLPLGQERLLDVQFRQLRYESIEAVTDACYHASQQLVRLVSEPQVSDYDDRLTTPRGCKYSLFRYVKFEDIIFDDKHGVMIRISFACPQALRGERLGPSKHLEDGMLVALVGLDKGKSLSVTFMQIALRQSTRAMQPRTGNNLRASVILSFADIGDYNAVRRMLYNQRGLLNERFVLVEVPNVLYAGFFWTLKNLQTISKSGRQIAFLPTIAPSRAGVSPQVSPPEYTQAHGFAYQLDVLRKEGAQGHGSLQLRPNDIVSNDGLRRQLVNRLCQETTLDYGQAGALCDNLCRGFAFTQGPPGTGKSFLGSSLTKVLLASQNSASKKPILVVCMTNHALDSFLDDLRQLGIDQIIRLGGNSKETWTREYLLRNLSRHMKKTTFERSRLNAARSRIEGLFTEGKSWCESLTRHVLSWPAVREHLKTRYPHRLARFTEIEHIEETILDDIRLARKAGGFAFDYWCSGGDIRDVNNLLKDFETLLGNTPQFQEDADERDEGSKYRVLDKIFLNADAVAKASVLADDDVWRLNLDERRALLEQWEAEIDPQTILDKTVEVHRRYQIAVSNKSKVHHDIDARCLAQRDVVGLTTTACAMFWQTLEKLDLKIVICEEAGEVMEAQILCTLFPTVEHAISIGDPLQLRPQVNEQSLSLETNLGKPYRLDESLIERMMLPSTVSVQPIPFSRLDIQRRMHPDIADLMRATRYPYLKDHSSTSRHRPVAGMADRVWWLDHSMSEDNPDPRSVLANSASNTFEVEMVAGLVEYLVNTNEYDRKDITVLTPYNAQLALFAQRFQGTCSLWLSKEDREALIEDGLLENEEQLTGSKTVIGVSGLLKLATIDNFQGEESKIVILSTVRSNPERRVGFLRTLNRINVACSRARDGFYIVGNATNMKTVETWGQIVGNLTSKSKIGPAFRAGCTKHLTQFSEIRTPEQWGQIPECKIPCGSKLRCGHSCTLTCHAEVLHERISCSEPCAKYHMCGHQCLKTCGEECGKCEVLMGSFTLHCGHATATTCGGTQHEICTAPIGQVQVSCGHQLTITCATQDPPLECAENCGQILDCGHQCQGQCHRCAFQGYHGKCTVQCSKELHCGHECQSPCHRGPCPPCKKPCLDSCPHGRCEQFCGSECDPCVKACRWTCVHSDGCTTMCCLPCNRLPCSEPCTKVMLCGHLCPSLCGEQCPTECIQCQTSRIPPKAVIALRCGHVFEVQYLDDYFDAARFYQINSTGYIERIGISSIQQLPGNRKGCPDCGEACTDIQRYAIHGQLLEFEKNMDRMYKKLCRKLHNALRDVYRAKEKLNQTSRSYAHQLRAGPLAGRWNEDLTRARGNELVDIQQSIIGFRDAVVQPFENQLSSLSTFFEVTPQNAEIDITLPYRHRFDVLYCRTRLIILEEGMRMLGQLRQQGDSSRHATLLIQSLCNLTLEEAPRHIAALEEIIAKCEVKNLKRLEAESRLVQACFHLLLKGAGRQSGLEVITSLNKTSDLCKTYPDTAGLLEDVYISIRGDVSSNQPTDKMYAKESETIWWSWPKHELGSLQYCKYGHPYSSANLMGCLECGRETPESERVTPNEPDSRLDKDDFLAAMKNFSLPGSYRSGPRQNR